MTPALDQGAAGNQTSLFGGGVSIGRYAVPSGKSVQVKALAFACAKPYNVLAAVPSATINCGVTQILVNGVQYSEARAQGNVLPNGAGWSDMPQPHEPACNLFHLGDGVVVPSGQVLLIRVTPANATETTWTACVQGLQSGAAQFQKATIQTRATTANQTILTYTPGADFTVLAVQVMGYQVGQIGGTAGLYANGMLAMDYGRCGQEQASTAPMDRGSILLPLWNMTFYPSDNFETLIQPWEADATEWQQCVFGADADLSAGGGATYSRSRVVNA